MPGAKRRGAGWASTPATRLRGTRATRGTDQSAVLGCPRRRRSEATESGKPRFSGASFAVQATRWPIRAGRNVRRPKRTEPRGVGATEGSGATSGGAAVRGERRRRAGAARPTGDCACESCKVDQRGHEVAFATVMRPRFICGKLHRTNSSRLFKHYKGRRPIFLRTLQTFTTRPLLLILAKSIVFSFEIDQKR